MGLRLVRRRGADGVEVHHFAQLDQITITLSVDLGRGTARTADAAESLMARHVEALTVSLAQFLGNWLEECSEDLGLEVRIK